MSAGLESPVRRETSGENAFAREVLDGLSRPQKTIPASWLPEHGVDATNDPALRVQVGDDAKGAGAAYSRNLLLRINRELGADFAPSAFRHEARRDAQRQRIEMHLVSEYTQRVTVMGRAFRFVIGESIHTGTLYEQGVVRFQALALRAGPSVHGCWCARPAKFAIHVLERAR
jgi:L-histidine Nalpha-methyltransferase